MVKQQKSNRLISLYRQILGWFTKKIKYLHRSIHKKYIRISYKILKIESVRRIYAGYLKLRKRFYARFIRHPKRFRISAALISALILAGFSYLIYGQLTQPYYRLTSAEAKLIGKADTNLMSKGKFAYDTKSQNFYLNKQSLGKSNSQPSQNDVTVGNSSSTATYDLKLPSDLSKGVTVQDNKSGLSFTLTTKFATASAKLKSGHLVYPLTNINGAQAVYTIKENGLQEDILLNHRTNNLKLAYKLTLPNYLSARSMSDGAIGVYSADPALFGNINYGSDSADQLKIAKARLNSQKNYLVFVLLPPVIRSTQSSISNPNGSKTSLSLKGNTLTLTATNLSHLAYPIDIDPSVLVTSATSFQTSGNNEGDINFSTGVSEAGLTGGALTSFTSTSQMTNTSHRFGSVAYNGYIYEIGGCPGDQSCATFTATVAFAQISGTGALTIQTSCPTGWTLGTSPSNAWCYMNSSLPNAWYDGSSVAYNGYVYNIGGCTSTCPITTVDYAPLNSDGTVGSWTATAGLTTTTHLETTAAYNGYLYEAGGENASGGTRTTTVEYALVHADGTLGTWTPTTSLPNVVSNESTIAYNGYIYSIAGRGSAASTAVVNYAPLNSDGTIGTWNPTTSLPLANSTPAAVAYNGYIYELGGCTTTCPTAVVDYASINSDGTLGSWNATTSLPTATNNITAVTDNGYIYNLGGCTAGNPCSTDTATVDYIAVEPTGYLGNENTYGTYALQQTNDAAASVTYNGYIYELGGYNGSASTEVEYAQIGSEDGLVVQASCPSGWTRFTTNDIWCYKAADLTATSRFSNAVAYNGYVYLFGGRFAGNPSTTVYYAPINSNGSLGTWNTTASMGTATEFSTAAVYNGYIYEIGGYDGVGNSSVATVQYTSVTSTGTLNAWSTTSALQIATQYATTVVYNGYLYVIGGCTSSCGDPTGNGSKYVEYTALSSNGTVTAPACSTSGWSLGGGGSNWCYDATSLPTATAWATSVAYNGYVYEMGGCNTSCGATPTPITNDEYAVINNDGSIGSWVTTTSLATNDVADATTVMVNEYVFIIGGYSGSAYLTTLDSFRINNGGPGTVGSWAATTTWPASSPAMPARVDLAPSPITATYM